MWHAMTKGKRDPWLSRLAKGKGCGETTIVIVTSAKSGWSRHVACNDKREERSMVVMTIQREGVWKDNNSHNN